MAAGLVGKSFCVSTTLSELILQDVVKSYYHFAVRGSTFRDFAVVGGRTLV